MPAEFAPGSHPTFAGPHLIAMLGDVTTAELAGLIAAESSGERIVEAIVSAGDQSSFVVAQMVGTVLRAQFSGTALAVRVDRADGTVVVFGGPVTPAWSTIVETDCVSVEIFDVAASPDDDFLPLGAGLTSTARVVFDRVVAAPHVEALEARAATPEPTTEPPERFARLEFANGSTIPLDSTILIGRSPRVERASSTAMPRLVPVDSPDAAISRTHLKISVDGDRAYLEDLNSTNGTAIIPADGAPQRLEPGEPALLTDGMVVTIAENLAFRVVQS